MSGVFKVVDRTWTTTMEQLQEGYVGAVAATVGVTAQWISRDMHKYDVELIRQPDKAKESSAVRAQLKSTTTLVVPEGATDFTYTFKSRDDFNALAMKRTMLKHILVVMVVHPDQRRWTYSHHRGMLMRHACYWLNLEGTTAPVSPAYPKVSVPTANIFNAKALTGILDRIEKGGTP